MMVMTDGTVLIHEDNTGAWEKLTPSSTGSYVNGTWSAVASMPSGYKPLYYASQILPTGQLLVEGGEYNGGNAEVWTNQGAVYNPISDTWTSVSPPATWLNIGDAQSVMLPTATGSNWTGGQFMMAHPYADGSGNSGMDDAVYNSNGTWTNIAGTGKLDRNDEEGWTLLPNDRVLTVDIEHNWDGTYGDTCTPCTSELFNPANGTWSATGNIPVDLPSYVGPDGPSEEMGPVVVQPNGNAFAIGANDATASYDSSTGTWTAGPTLAGSQDSADGAGSILPDGNVLFDASPGVFNAPTHFFVWDGSTITQVADTARASSDSSYVTRFVVLPTGQVMFDDGTGDIEIYNADQTFNSSWEPTITSISSSTLSPGSTYSLTGTQLSGRSDGAAYGDDNQSATNYPLVRITNNATHVVTYARTSGFSYAIASGAPSETSFTMPSSAPPGASTLQVVANGIPSAGQAVTIPGITVDNPGPQTGTVGNATSLQINASDTDPDTPSYSATGLPPGLSIDPTTGMISGTPTSTGTFPVTVTVADSEESRQTSFTWTINRVTVVNPGSQTATVGNLVSLQIQASDSDGGTLSYSATGLPPGLSIGSSTGDITGTPTTTGSFSPAVTATDAKGGSRGTSFTWTINPASPTELTVSLGGSGSGKVTSAPAGISCPGACSASFAHGTQVTLSANPSPGSKFAGWSGGGCSGTGACTLSMSSDTSVSATFNRTGQSGPQSANLQGSPKSTGSGVRDTVSCTAAAGQTCRITQTLTTEETTKGGKPVAVSAAARKKRKMVIVGSKTVTVPAGSSATVTIKLNSSGRRLLKRFGKLPVMLTIKLTQNAGQVTVATRRLTIKRPRKPKHVGLLALSLLLRAVQF